MPAPDFTSETESVQIALSAARTSQTSETLMRYLVFSTAGTKNAALFFRPYAAAAAWLESDTTAMVKGEGGFALADRPTAVASLKARQRDEDVKAGLIAQAYRRPFVGVSR